MRTIAALSTIAFIALFTVGVLAQEKSVPPPPKPDTQAQQTPASSNTQSSEPATEIDKSYALGMSIGLGLRKQNVAVDPGVVAHGLSDAMAGGKTLLTEDEMRAALQQLKADRHTENDNSSYALGMSIGLGLHKQNVGVDPGVVAHGLSDAMAGGKTLLTEDEMRAALQQLKAEVHKEQGARAHLAGEAARTQGEAFLAANKSKEGVITLPSGLQYRILTAGSGPKPTTTDTVTVNYRGTLIDGREFDSSYKRGQPISFPVGGVIKGWIEALQLMPVGSKWELFIPADLAYGDRGAGSDIGPGETLVFEVELLSIGDQKKSDYDGHSRCDILDGVRVEDDARPTGTGHCEGEADFWFTNASVEVDCAIIFHKGGHFDPESIQIINLAAGEKRHKISTCGADSGEMQYQCFSHAANRSNSCMAGLSWKQ